MNSSLLLLLYFASFVLQGTQGLIAPRNVRVEIEGDTVTVSWDHIEPDQTFKGYYVVLEDVGSGQKENPAYVHVSSGERCAKIIGLRPGTSYTLMVSAHSSDTHKTSEPITINTDKLQFLHAESLTVSNITNVSATLQWTHAAKNNIHHIRFKLVCVGVQTFSRNGELMEERSDLSHESWSTSRGRESYAASGLLPNCRYTCRLLSLARERQSEADKAPQVTFHTNPGRPSRPPRPRLALKVVGKRTSNFSLELYPSDDQFGKIDHYKVVAVPVTRTGDQPRTVPYKPVVPLSNLLNHTLSKKLATKVVERVPFFVEEYQSGELPPTLKIAGKWVHKAFKIDTHYSFVVVAFTKSGKELLYTISEPADPPVLIGHDEVREAVFRKKRVTRRFENTILVTMLSVLGIFSAAFLLVFVTKYYQSSKRDTYYFAVAEDSSSDEETVYIKQPATKEKTPYRHFKTLSPPSPCPEGGSKAEWAVKNMFFNPAFEETVFRSPETLQEMEQTMNVLSDYRTGQNVDETQVPLEGTEEMEWGQQQQQGDLMGDLLTEEIIEIPSIEAQLVPLILPPPPPPLPGPLTDALEVPSLVVEPPTPLPAPGHSEGVPPPPPPPPPPPFSLTPSPGPPPPPPPPPPALPQSPGVTPSSSPRPDSASTPPTPHRKKKRRSLGNRKK